MLIPPPWPGLARASQAWLGLGWPGLVCAGAHTCGSPAAVGAVDLGLPCGRRPVNSKRKIHRGKTFLTVGNRFVSEVTIL